MNIRTKQGFFFVFFKGNGSSLPGQEVYQLHPAGNAAFFVYTETAIIDIIIRRNLA
jgi:hypothetical protein